MYNISELVVTMTSLYVAYNSWFFIESMNNDNSYKKKERNYSFAYME